MNKTIVFISALLLICFASCREQGNKLLLGGSGWNKIVIIDKETKQIGWEHPLEQGWECNSVAVTPKGNILFSYAKGAKEITTDHQEIWNIVAPDSCEMQTASILPDGNYLLAWCGHPAVIMEVSPKGVVLSRTEYETGIEAPHAQFRHVSKNKQGNYLMPLFETSEVREISPAGELVKSMKVGGTPFCIVPVSNGNHIVACGDGHNYIELNYETGELIRQVSELEGNPFFFVAQLYPTADGGLYVCNWQGHDQKSAEGHYPQLVEVDPSGKVVWELNDGSVFGMISTVCPY